jgi:drug/metabolite transporter (DMT)-like permease
VSSHHTAIAPLPRPTVYAGLAVGLVAVSSSAVLATYVIGDPPVLRLALAIAFWRCFGGAVALVPFAWRVRRSHPIDRVTTRALLGSGAFLAVHFALFLGSLAFTTVGSSTTLATASPIFVALGGIWFLQERPTRRTWIGMGITMLGAFAIGAADLAELELGTRALLGDVMAFGSALAVTGYLLIGRGVRGRVHATTYSAVVYAAAAVLLVVVCAATGTPLWGYSGGQWAAIIGIIVGPQLLGHTVFNTLMSTVPATVISIVVLAEPVAATILALVFLDQLPAPLFWFAAPIVILGVGIASIRPRRPIS